IANMMFPLLGKPRKASLQKIISRFSKRKDDIFFIQIGSNDGVTRDPLHRHITKDQWRGIVVEPVRYIYEKLIENYRYYPRVSCENLAIADENGTREFYRLKESDDGLPEWYDQIGSFNPDIVETHSHKINNFYKYYITEQVDCITLETLLKRHNVQKIDLIHIDTEGYDHEIIKMINFDKFNPEIIMFEHKHLPIETYKEVIHFLKEKHYKLYSEKNDTMAILRG
ncbi:MAG: FkbM family methyltransferase, partial [Balneolales bacterium]